MTAKKHNGKHHNGNGNGDFFAETKAILDKIAQRQEEFEVWKKNHDKQMGELSQKLGTLVEDFVIPDMANMLLAVDPSINEDDIIVNARVKRRHPITRQQIEMDTIADGGQVVLVNETKNSLKIEYIDNFLSRLATFKEFFKEYQDFRLYGMVSSLYVDPSVVTYGQRQGLLVVALKPGLLQVLNEKGFMPKEF